VAAAAKRTSQATGPKLQGDKITDAGFVQSACVIDDENIPWFRCSYRLEKNVRAAVVSHRERPAGQLLVG